MILEIEHAEHVIATVRKLGLKSLAQFNLLCQCMSLIADAIINGQITSHGDLKKLIEGMKKRVEVAPIAVRTESLIFQLGVLPEPKYPSWSEGLIFKGIVEPKSLDLNNLDGLFWRHDYQKLGKAPIGDVIIKTLVKGFDRKKALEGHVHQVESTDLINGFHGLRTANLIVEKWSVLPEEVKDQLQGKSIPLWSCIVRGNVDYLQVPCLNCGASTPCVLWRGLDGQWLDDEPGLREQVGTLS